MPELARFYGIRITMNSGDHPPPHFHAEYGDDEAMISIQTGDVLEGELPGRAARLVKEWVELHRAELEANWVRARAVLPLQKIAPL